VTDQPPPELPGGQESEVPDLRLALVVTIALLSDVEPVLRTEPELLLRLAAVRSVLRRLRAHVEETS
jgi:hypothetical protein